MVGLLGVVRVNNVFIDIIKTSLAMDGRTLLPKYIEYLNSEIFNREDSEFLAAIKLTNKES